MELEMTEQETSTRAIPVVEMAELLAEPHAVMGRLRETDGLMRTDPRRVGVLRFDDVQRLAAAPGVLQIPGASYADVMGIPPGAVRDFLAASMLMSNGEDHARRRGAFARTFAHPAIKARRAEVRAVADAIVADLPRGAPFDLHVAASSRLPAEIIAAILGLSADDSRGFREQVYTLSRCLAPPYDPAGHAAVEAAARALHDFVARELDARRMAPRDDLLSRLVADEGARALEEEALVHQVVTLILAGSDTTRSAFTIVVGLLLQDRGRWERVRADRGLIPAAIDEALRIEPPIGTMPRFLPAPLEVAGTEVAGGQMLALMTIAAMRDPARFGGADRFDLDRPDRMRPHLVFGGGAHRCLGEMLARIELEEGLAALMDAAPGIEMLEAPKVLGYGGIRKATGLIARIG
jgi:cytochrome P450